jgi:hypothetical protein
MLPRVPGCGGSDELVDGIHNLIRGLELRIMPDARRNSQSATRQCEMGSVTEARGMNRSSCPHRSKAGSPRFSSGTIVSLQQGGVTAGTGSFWSTWLALAILRPEHQWELSCAGRSTGGDVGVIDEHQAAVVELDRPPPRRIDDVVIADNHRLTG